MTPRPIAAPSQADHLRSLMLPKPDTVPALRMNTFVLKNRTPGESDLARVGCSDTGNLGSKRRTHLKLRSTRKRPVLWWPTLVGDGECPDGVPEGLEGVEAPDPQHLAP